MLILCPVFRIERQRLLAAKNINRFSRPIKEPSPEDTRRILDGIHQINLQLGYVKKPKEVRPRQNIESYFYPRPPYHPFVQQDSSYEGIKYARHIQTPFSSNAYVSPVTFFQVPSDLIGSFYQHQRKERQQAQDYYSILNQRDNLVGQSNADLIREKQLLVSTVQKIVNDMRDNNGDSRQLEQAVVMPVHRRKPATKSKSSNKKLPQTSIIVVSPVIDGGRAEDVSSQKTILRPFKSKGTPPVPKTPHQNLTIVPVVSSTPKPSFLASLVPSFHKTSPKVEQTEDDYEDEISQLPEKSFKGPFSSYFENQKEQVVEALKQGGVIIQRLRVREGGIAIAGPQGIASAGSGGTAIVGPGGIALTHPRSLSIAGPGARVYAVPESVDLRELAMRSDARSIPDQGVLVATGPVVYWNPELTKQT